MRPLWDRYPMKYLETKRILQLEVDPEIEAACLFLECRGLEFAVNFGTDNAIQKAGEWILKRTLR
jgi:hypothetical protein